MSKTLKKIALCLSLFLCLMAAPRQTQANFSDLNFGLGVMNQAIGQYQTARDGSRSSFNHRLALETGLLYDLNTDWFLTGDFGFLWPGGTDDSFISKQIYYLTAHGGYRLLENFHLRVGGSLYMTRISGDGGTVPIRNGTGTTNFPIPEDTATSSNMTFNVAGEYFFAEDYSAKLEVFVFNPVISRNRTFNYALTVRYHLGDSLWQD